MATEKIIVAGQEHEIEVRPITLIFKSPDLPHDVQTPQRIMIEPCMTLWHTANTPDLHPKTERYFRIVFENYEEEFRLDIIRCQGVGMKHVLGLIDLTLRYLDAGANIGWRYPESYLHPKHQVQLGDVLIALIDGDEKLIDLVL